jgi:hypothetical protein
MTDPLSAPLAVMVQPASRAAQLLPDKALSAEESRQISLQCYAAHLEGIDDITLRECLKSGEAKYEDLSQELKDRLEIRRPISEEKMLNCQSELTLKQALAKLRLQQQQEEGSKLSNVLYDGYGRDLEYGGSKWEGAQEDLIAKVIADAKDMGITLTHDNHG